MKSAKTSGNTINQLPAIKKVTNYESTIFNNYIVQLFHGPWPESNQNHG